MRKLEMWHHLKVTWLVGTELELEPHSFIQPSNVQLQCMPGNTIVLPSSHLTGPGKDPKNFVVQDDHECEYLTDLSTCSRPVS